MKVLHLVQGYYPAIGGTEFLIKNVSEKLVSLFQDDVTVFTTTAYNTEGFVLPNAPLMAPGEEVIDGVKIRRFPVFNSLGPALKVLQYGAFRLHLPFNDRLRALYSGPLIFSIIPAVLGFDADVVAASSFPLLHMHYAGLAKRFKNRPVVLCGGLHVEDRWGFDRKVIYKAIRRADAYIAYTTFEKEFLIGKGIKKDKIHVIGVGVDPVALAKADGKFMREKYNLGDMPVIAFVGQQGGHKGIDTLLYSMRLVWKKVPQAKLIIAGARTSYSAQLDKIISSFEKEKKRNVVKIDNPSDNEKHDILKACDIFASPSGFESFGITFLEAWAAGKPVIGTRSGAIPAVIEENQDGLLVDYGDANELASAILELLFDDVLREKLVQRGREKILANYTWEIIARKFRRVYESVL